MTNKQTDIERVAEAIYNLEMEDCDLYVVPIHGPIARLGAYWKAKAAIEAMGPFSPPGKNGLAEILNADTWKKGCETSNAVNKLLVDTVKNQEALMDEMAEALELAREYSSYIELDTTDREPNNLHAVYINRNSAQALTKYRNIKPIATEEQLKHQEGIYK